MAIDSSTARTAMLERIRSAIKDVPADETPADVVQPRDYLLRDDAPHAEQVERFIEYVVDYRATVHRVSEDDLPARIAQSCAERGVHRLVIPADLPAAWRPTSSDLTLLPDDPAHPLTIEQLETSDGVLTGCALGIAQTGTIVLDGRQHQGRRVISLLPDYHLCVVYERQVVGIVPEAVTALYPAAIEERRPITFISGPSATSDIELNRVEGVHGPRTLEVLLVSA